MADLSQHEFVQALGATLLHFLWQGALLGGAAAVLLWMSRSARARYTLGVATLVAMVAAPVATFSVLAGKPLDPMTAAANDMVSALTQPTGDVDRAGNSTAIEPAYWPAAGVVVWLSGILVLSVRLAGGWIVAKRMARRAVRPAAAHIQAVASDLAERLALRRTVQVLESSAVAVPVLVGWLRPVVVFPVAALAGLSPAQIEALLAHELAHVRRHDYLVNVLQSFAEIVLFYHPAVWWVSRRVRAERELCCDDVTVGLCDRLVYATALTDLAAMMSPRVALAATGGDLIARVRRILGREESVMSGKSRWLAGAIVLAALVAAVPVVLAQVKPQQAPAVAEYVSMTHVLPVESKKAEEQASRAVNVARSDIEALRALLESLKLQEASEAQSIEQVDRLRREERARAAELEAAQAELDRMRKMVDVGLATKRQLAELETALARIEAGKDVEKQRVIELEAARRLRAQNDATQSMKIELESAQKEFERARMLMERGLLSERDVQERERAIMDLRQREVRKKDAEMQRVVKEIVDQREKRKVEDQEKIKRIVEDVRKMAESRELRAKDQQAEVNELRARRAEVERGRAVIRDRVEEDTSNRAIVAADSVVVSIEGETQLPTVYRVDADGSIRIPLLGTFKVVGQTPSQVREAIGKKLSDSRLGSSSRVRVALRRR